MRTLRDISEIANDGLGQGRPRDRPRRVDLVRRQQGSRQHRRDGQVPEHRRAAVALDRRRPLPRPRCTTSRSATCTTWPTTSTPTTTAGRRAWATSSARAWGRRSSTTPSTTSAASTTSPTWRSPSTTRRRSTGPRDWPTTCTPGSRTSGGCRTRPSTPTRSGRSNEKIEQKHWITSTPMETELTVDGRAVPGLASQDHGAASLALHETPCFSGDRPLNRGLFHTGCGGGPDGAGEAQIFSLNTGIQAVGEGNYGRLGASSRSATPTPTSRPMFGEPATGGTPDEQPGSMPEILPSPDGGSARTSTAAGPAGRCSCRRGATTAPRGRSCTSSSACGRTSAATA